VEAPNEATQRLLTAQHAQAGPQPHSPPRSKGYGAVQLQQTGVCRNVHPRQKPSSARLQLGSSLIMWRRRKGHRSHYRHLIATTTSCRLRLAPSKNSLKTRKKRIKKSPDSGKEIYDSIRTLGAQGPTRRPWEKPSKAYNSATSSIETSVMVSARRLQGPQVGDERQRNQPPQTNRSKSRAHASRRSRTTALPPQPPLESMESCPTGYLIPFRA